MEINSIKGKGYKVSLGNALALLPGPNGELFIETLKHGSLLAGIFTPGRVDNQAPHTRDEIYIVMKGSGEFINGGERESVEQGDFLFVPAGVEHRFENFTEDLTLWVIFYGPEGGEKE
jgi:mannose-6-phosphate isomerase-like protein (cupin superfamily)